VLVRWREHFADLQAAARSHYDAAVARITNRIDRGKAADLAHRSDSH
jgi:hypothetical protein